MILMYANIFADILERREQSDRDRGAPTHQGADEHLQKQDRWTDQMFL